MPGGVCLDPASGAASAVPSFMTTGHARSADELRAAFQLLDETTDSLPNPRDSRRETLKQLHGEAESLGDPELERQLLWETQLAYATVSSAAVHEQTRPRFVGFAPDLQEEAALDYLVGRLTSPSVFVRALVGDFLWEYGGPRRKHAIATPNQMLDLADLLAAAARNGAEFGWLHANDPVIRAGQLATATNNLQAKRAVADRALALLGELKTDNPRHAMDMLIALTTVAGTLTAIEIEGVNLAAAEITSNLERAEQGAPSHLGRAVLALRKSFLQATGAPAEDIARIDSAAVETLIKEGDSHLANNNGLVASVAYGEALDRLSRMPGEAALAAELRKKLRDANLASTGQMTTQTFTEEIPTAVVEAFYDSFTTVPFPEVLEHLALRTDLLIGVEEAREAERKAQEIAPFASMVRHVELTPSGRRIAPTKPEDIERQKLYRAIRFHREFQNVWMAEIFRRLRDQCGIEVGAVIEYLRMSGNFDEGNLALVDRGWERAWADDTVSAMHILLPQLEDTLRNLLNRSGIDPLAAGTSIPGVGMELTLAPICSRLQEADVLDEDTAFLVDLTVADPLGENLRNEVGHGLIRLQECTWPRLARVLQLYLIVATLKPAVTD